jgi:hypothetical protein
LETVQKESMERFKKAINSITDWDELKSEMLSAIELGIFADIYDGTEEDMETYAEYENIIRVAMYDFIKNKKGIKT